ncbi:SPW repeat domain-containing protein [Sulfobacillus harzensis]|uniref:SPW repeat domain-containing protein n=1 Tax=Sulfobacillus harzensis TaxID=2729629 RepID=UPI003083FFE4
MTWRNVLMAIFGAWFVVSAWALNPMNSNAYLWTAIILGGLTLIGSVWALVDRARRAWRYWLEALFGLYLGLMPFFYGFASHTWALWVTMVIGAAMLVGGLWNALSHQTDAEGHFGNRAA